MNRALSLTALLVIPALAACTSQAQAALPARLSLSGVGYEAQGFNNCGPVTAKVILGYHGTVTPAVIQWFSANEIKRTSSGKIARRVAKKSYLAS